MVRPCDPFVEEPNGLNFAKTGHIWWNPNAKGSVLHDAMQAMGQ
jgi:hypothetical protein